MSDINKYYLPSQDPTPVQGLTELAPISASTNTPLQPDGTTITESGDGLNLNSGNLSSPNLVAGQSGWRLQSNGNVEFGSGKFRGDITGASGTFSGTITASSGTIGGFSISATALTANNFSLDSSTQRLTLGSGNDILIADADDATYRLWIGDSTPASAPFSVDKDGGLIATNATISGSITATTGTIGGFSVGSDYIRNVADSFGLASTVTGGNDVMFWAGDTFANRASADFRVLEDGSVVASALTITGGSISIGGQTVVNTDGSSEFLKTLIGRQQVTVDNTANLQTALDDLDAQGGGILYLKAGTYTLSSSLTYYSNITIRGISQSSTILDFNNTGAGLVAAGSGVYTTGTLTSITGGVTVTGSGTSWSGNVTAGQQLFLNNRWHVIAVVNSNTSLTLAEPYSGPAVTAGTAYRIASPMVNIALEFVTVKNATQEGFDVDDVREIEINNVTFLDCNVGFDYTNVSEVTSNIVITASNASHGYSLTNVGFGNFNTLSASGNGGSGAVMNNVNTVFFGSSSGAGNTADGFNLTNVRDVALIVEASSNGGQGIELVSGCDNVFIYAALIRNNTSDGIKLTGTCDNNTIGGSVNIIGNGGYGANIAASTCDDNLILGVHFEGNTSGEINDSGTGTVVQACLPLSVNDGQSVSQVFTSDGTWTKPNNIKFVQVVCIGAGGGGGSGRRGASGTDRYGGAGGGGGAASVAILNADDLSATESVVVGVGGTGATGVTTDSTNGNNGTDGTASSFGSLVFAGGGGGGEKGRGDSTERRGGGGGGVIGNASGFTGGTPTVAANAISGQGPSGPAAVGRMAEYGGASGGGGAAVGVDGNNGGSSIYSSGGGGGGGAIDSGNIVSNGGQGGTVQAYTSGGGGSAGTGGGNGGNGSANSTTKKGYGGDGGGGGAASTSANSGNGGTGGIPGGGGGGGAASANGFTSGAGGNGARGEVRVYSW